MRYRSLWHKYFDPRQIQKRDRMTPQEALEAAHTERRRRNRIDEAIARGARILPDLRG